ncbi:50S ribosomal protein L28 [Candidatus Uhrbacteria bacterium]|nr:50S ribosomal protein L28 [Candidatus Uhrbacteria bacterium]
MARQCHLCQRSSLKAKSRSHSNIGTNRRQKVNLQKRWIDGSQMLLCTNCLKTLKGKRPELFVAAPKKKAAPAKKK